jgi:hypothetical protein
LVAPKILKPRRCPILRARRHDRRLKKPQAIVATVPKQGFYVMAVTKKRFFLKLRCKGVLAM